MPPRPLNLRTLRRQTVLPPRTNLTCQFWLGGMRSQDFVGRLRTVSSFPPSPLISRTLSTDERPKEHFPPVNEKKSEIESLVNSHSTPSNEGKEPKKSLWTRVKEGVKFYWVGTQLLAADVSVAYKLIRRRTRGHSLNRRERLLLRRVTADILRLVPFAFFIIVPFMELLLPVALKLFPNMLPSTFKEESKKEEDKKRQLKLRLELASFLGDMWSTMYEMNSPKGALMNSVLQKMRHGERVSKETIVEMAKEFSDDLTLENLSKENLSLLCRYMGITPYGSDPILRFRVAQKLNSIKKDDEEIFKEGIDSLSIPELKQAVRDRGMRTIGVSTQQLRKNLRDWLELSLKYQIPPALLVLSSAFNLSNKFAEQPLQLDGIQQTLKFIDNEVVEEVLMKSGGANDEQRLTSLRRIKDKIETRSSKSKSESTQSQPEITDSTNSSRREGTRE